MESTHKTIRLWQLIGKCKVLLRNKRSIILLTFTTNFNFWLMNFAKTSFMNYRTTWKKPIERFLEKSFLKIAKRSYDFENMTHTISWKLLIYLPHELQFLNTWRNIWFSEPNTLYKNKLTNSSFYDTFLFFLLLQLLLMKQIIDNKRRCDL